MLTSSNNVLDLQKFPREEGTRCRFPQGQKIGSEALMIWPCSSRNFSHIFTQKDSHKQSILYNFDFSIEED